MNKSRLHKIFTLSFIFVFCDSISAGEYTNWENEGLPVKAVNFIKEYFYYDDINKLSKIKKSFQVMLKSGTELIFEEDGEWDEVNGHRISIPTDFMPKNVMDTVKRTNPHSGVIRIRKRWNMYVIGLDNYMNVFIDFSGMLIGQAQNKYLND